MTTWQERIVYWRFGNSVPKRVFGFLLKGGIEAGTLSAPIGIAVLALTYGLGLPITELDAVPADISNPRVVSWLILTALSWLKLRCFLTDQVDLEPVTDQAEATPEASQQ